MTLFNSPPKGSLCLPAVLAGLQVIQEGGDVEAILEHNVEFGQVPATRKGDHTILLNMDPL